MFTAEHNTMGINQLDQGDAKHVYMWQDKDQDLTTEAVMKKLHILKTDKLAGPDEIYMMLLKNCA